MPSTKDETGSGHDESRSDDEAPLIPLPLRSTPAAATAPAAMPMPMDGLSCQNLPNDAQDTIKEVLGWYGLQETPSLREDDGLDPSIGSKIKIESPSSDPPMTPLDLTSGSTSPNISCSDQTSGCSTGASSASWSGHRKLIGMRFLFPPLSDDLSLLEKARIWVARHEHKYFVGWTEDDLKHIDPLLRPLTSITPETYKLHMNRSEYCRNVKLKYCLESDSEWAQEFQRKLSRPPSEGGFTGLCQAKIAAAELWRKFSENYRSHQARYPNPKSKVRGKSWSQDSKEGVKRSTPEECEEEEEEEEKRSRVITMEPKDLSSHSNGSSECSSMNGEKDCVANKLNIAELSLQGMAACPSPVYYGMPMHGFPFVPSPYMPPMDLKPGSSPKHAEKNSEYKRSERGLSFLFPSLSDHNLSLLDKVRITVLRHKNNYFLGWAEEELVKVDPLVRPKMRITHEIYKEYCHRNAMKYDSNLQFAMESEEEWAVEFRSKLLKPPSDGGFSSLCEVKLEAGRLWREYSGKYRMHNIVKWQMDLNTAKPPVEETPHSALDIKPDISLLGGSLHRSASLDQLMPPSNHIVRGHKRSRSSVCSSPATSSSLISPSSSSEASKARSTPPTRVQSPEYRDSLFVPLPRHLSVAEQLIVWLERHKNAYFLGQTQEDLLRLNDLVRPTMVVTEEVFKHFIPESMVDVLNKIEQIMQRDEPWARVFRDRVHKPVMQGGFSSFEEALTEAVVLWHSHTPPSSTAGKQKDILFDKWIKHQKHQIDSYNDIWAFRSQLRDLCRDDPTQSLHTKLQPYLPLLRHKLGAEYNLPTMSSDCVVDLVLSVLQTNADARLKSQ